MEGIEAFLSDIERTGLAEFIQVTSWAFPTIESIHVVSIGLVVGVIAILDLRLIGIASSAWPIRRVSRDTLPWVWGAFVIAVISGSLLFISQASNYFGNTSFRIKMILLLLAGINMMVFELITARSMLEWDTDPRRVPLGAKIAATLSLIFWIGVVAAGRWVGFSMSPF